MVRMNRNIITLFGGIKVFRLTVYLLSTTIIGSFVVYTHRSLLPPPPPPQNYPTQGIFVFLEKKQKNTQS